MPSSLQGNRDGTDYSARSRARQPGNARPRIECRFDRRGAGIAKDAQRQARASHGTRPEGDTPSQRCQSAAAHATNRRSCDEKRRRNVKATFLRHARHPEPKVAHEPIDESGRRSHIEKPGGRRKTGPALTRASQARVRRLYPLRHSVRRTNIALGADAGMRPRMQWMRAARARARRTADPGHWDMASATAPRPYASAADPDHGGMANAERHRSDAGNGQAERIRTLAVAEQAQAHGRYGRAGRSRKARTTSSDGLEQAQAPGPGPGTPPDIRRPIRASAGARIGNHRGSACQVGTRVSLHRLPARVWGLCLPGRDPKLCR